jgi:hypothetical protein
MNGPRCVDYDSHDWQWIDGDRVCVDCALIDFDGARVVAAFTAALGLPAGALRHRAAASP